MGELNKKKKGLLGKESMTRITSKKKDKRKKQLERGHGQKNRDLKGKRGLLVS